MTQEELTALVDAGAQRLGIGSSAPKERHRQIMQLAGQVQRHYEKRPYQRTSPVKAKQPVNLAIRACRQFSTAAALCQKIMDMEV